MKVEEHFLLLRLSAVLGHTLSKPPEGQATGADAVRRKTVVVSHRSYSSSMSNLDMQCGF